jgi:acyl-CoA hydrolase
MEGTGMDGRPVRESLSEISEMALPIYANPLGNLLGGRIMHLMDLVAATAAMRHARSAVVTASADYVSFLHPIHIGQLVILRAAVNRVFRTSMEVGVKVWVEDLRTGEVNHTNSSYLTFVALDDEGTPRAVPAALPESVEERRRWEQAGARRKMRLELRQKAIGHDAAGKNQSPSASL